ncbi:DUF2785 domain-containing protein [Bacillus salitolerans]|uniref:DUF2785 domain-containing protein n=1 Tax=Bacillus salitolerans TaxID=1437434 RepID=A0ABW4LTQ2_9BACI
MIKEELQRVVESGYKLPDGLTEYEAVSKVVDILDSTDPELRDQLGYTILYKWLIEQKFLTNKELREQLDVAVSDKMLFHKVGESETDSVFLRAFSSLLIALLLHRDNQDPFLDKESFDQILHRLVAYCEEERDVRGYVEEKGWAHAAAHIADALEECVQSEKVHRVECETLWIGICALINHAHHVFDAEEDERMATVVVAMVALEKVSVKTICEWLQKVEVTKGQDITFRYRRVNWKHFVRSIYTRLQEKNLLGEADLALQKEERRFNPYFSKL